MRNLSELQHEVESLSLTCPSGATKEDLMDMLAVSHREHDVTGRPPLIPQHPVMLARNMKDLKSDMFDGMLLNKSGLWIAEEKLDGVRAKLHLGKVRNRIDSRHRSDVTYEYIEKTDCLPHLKNMPHTAPGTILDGELIMPVERITCGKTVTDSQLTSTTATVNSSPERAIELQKKFGYCYYYMFDILFHCGEDVRQLPYSKRYKLLLDLHSRNFYFRTFELIRLPKCSIGRNYSTFFTSLVKDGGEGIMLKRLDWPYESRKRSKGMYKLKKQKEMDCFITGFVPGKGEFSGLVGALKVSIMRDEQAIEIAAVQPGDLPFRREISDADGSLCDSMYGKVLEVSYLCKTKNKRLRHAVLERWRHDKNMYECTGSF